MPGHTRSQRGLSDFTFDALKSELTRRQRRVAALQRKHARLLSAAARIERQIQAAGGSLNGTALRPVRRRPRNEMNLVQALAKVLKGRVMGVTEVAKAVQAAGYKTTSPNFRTIVNQTLIKSPLFKRPSRGKYTVK
jgi:hypothetical protein